eukprot:TRINITY_DN3095_c2_g1_i2.p3 TRINITY_DN3095_c2_g1~~TRINITY_DN3095_c2_g1_i2.p3  ORF type:complete len:157 (-),score=10.65 TRINITY_DN3095_c2_g1_i2:386-856(-)
MLSVFRNNKWLQSLRQLGLRTQYQSAKHSFSDQKRKQPKDQATTLETELKSLKKVVHSGRRKYSIKDRKGRNELPFSVRVSPMKPMNIEVSHRTMTAIYLYAPQKIVLPTLIDFDIVCRPKGAKGLQRKVMYLKKGPRYWPRIKKEQHELEEWQHA